MPKSPRLQCFPPPTRPLSPLLFSPPHICTFRNPPPFLYPSFPPLRKKETSRPPLYRRFASGNGSTSSHAEAISETVPFPEKPQKQCVLWTELTGKNRENTEKYRKHREAQENRQSAGKRKQSVLPKRIGHTEETILPPRFTFCKERNDRYTTCEHRTPHMFMGGYIAYWELTILFEGVGGLTCSSPRRAERDSAGGIGGHG